MARTSATASLLWLALIICLGAAPAARGSTVQFSGQALGSFNNLVLSGTEVSGTGQPVAFDNTSTARYRGVGSSSLEWGDSYFGKGSPSIVTFTGASFSNVAANTPFVVGSFYYFDGINSPSSVIFGGDLIISIPDLTESGGASTSFSPISLPFEIMTTINTGSSPVSNADHVLFPGLGGAEVGALEHSSLTAILVGEFSGGGLHLHLAPTPEPTSLLLFGLGAMLIAGAVLIRQPKLA